jgi:hypothetical protein
VDFDIGCYGKCRRGESQRQKEFAHTVIPMII